MSKIKMIKIYMNINKHAGLAMNDMQRHMPTHAIITLVM